MTHIAQQRIKKGGKYFAAGDPIALTEKELAELPNGAVVPGDSTASDDDASQTTSVELTDEQQTALAKAVAALKPTAFKQDGEIRAGALKGLNDQLDFDVTVEAVAAVKA